jgi:hypothetical protein
MLSNALPYKSVFMRVSHEDKQYTCYSTKEEWKFVADVVERFKMFSDICDIFFGTDYVTANLFFYKVCEIRCNIREWSTCGNPLIEAMSYDMEAKFKK